MTGPTNGSQTPAGLLAFAKAGDQAALSSLIESCRNYLTVLARSQIGEVLRVDVSPSDVVQETLLEAYRGFGQFKGGSEREFLSWLRRILARNIVDKVKRERAARRGGGRTESLEALLERSSARIHEALAAGISSPSEKAAEREQAVILADALARLPDEYRQVMVLRHIDRLKFEEIAARLGKTSGAIRKLWTRALLKLRAALEGLR